MQPAESSCEPAEDHSAAESLPAGQTAVVRASSSRAQVGERPTGPPLAITASGLASGLPAPAITSSGFASGLAAPPSPMLSQAPLAGQARAGAGS